MLKQDRRVPVSKRSLIQRLNRHLRAKGQRIRKTLEGTPSRESLGEYYILDEIRDRVVVMMVDLEAYGRKLGVMEAWEGLERLPPPPYPQDIWR